MLDAERPRSKTGLDAERGWRVGVRGACVAGNQQLVASPSFLSGAFSSPEKAGISLSPQKGRRYLVFGP